MIKQTFILFVFVVFIFEYSPSLAQSRFEQIQDGVNESTAKKSGGDDSTDSSFSSGQVGLNDTVFLGTFENYLPTKRQNVQITVFAEPRKFLLGHRACTRIIKIRDKINHFFFDTEMNIDNRGRADTTNMDAGVRQAIKDGLKTKLEYFASIYVIPGRFNMHKIPKELEGQSVTDCAGVISKKASMDKGK